MEKLSIFVFMCAACAAILFLSSDYAAALRQEVTGNERARPLVSDSNSNVVDQVIAKGRSIYHGMTK